MYKIDWVDYEPTWQPAGDLKGCDDAIWDFHDARPDLPGPPAWCKKRKKAKRNPDTGSNLGSGEAVNNLVWDIVGSFADLKKPVWNGTVGCQTPLGIF
jgi:hypothetical protein